MISTNQANPLIGQRNGRTLLRVPNIPDEPLLECLIANGMPKRHAWASLQSPQLRTCCIVFYFDVEAIEKGEADSDARLRVDLMRDNWAKMRRAEIALGNDPDVGPKPHVLTADKLVTL